MVRAVGGLVRINSRPGKGTRLNILSVADHRLGNPCSFGRDRRRAVCIPAEPDRPNFHARPAERARARGKAARDARRPARGFGRGPHRKHHPLSRTGHGALEAALRGSREIGFTVLSMSTSLVAVFIPILLMGGIVGRMFREFAVTLSVAVAISMVVSLTTTPTMCAKLLKRTRKGQKHNWLLSRQRARIRGALRWICQQPALGLATSAARLWHYAGHGLPGGLSLHCRSQGLLPAAGHRPLERQCPGLAEDISFQTMRQKLTQYMAIVQTDPAVDIVAGNIGRRPNTGRTSISR